MTTAARHVRWILAAGLGLAVTLAPAPPGRAADEVAPAAPAEVERSEDAPRVEPGAVVHLEFTLRDEDGTLLDDNHGRSPLVFTYGGGEVIPGLEHGLAGMKIGEARRITVGPEEAYGPVDPDAMLEVPASRVPPEDRVVGARLVGQTRSGREVPVRVREIREDTVVLDLNHPLAGHTLVFDVRVILIEPP